MKKKRIHLVEKRERLTMLEQKGATLNLRVQELGAKLNRKKKKVDAWNCRSRNWERSSTVRRRKSMRGTVGPVAKCAEPRAGWVGRLQRV